MRFVRRYGFGIQSPWAYSFVKDVLYEKLRYYAYDDLLLQFPGRKGYAVRRDEQIFRLVNFFKPKAIIVPGGCSLSSMGYMQAASKLARVIDADVTHLSDSQLASSTFIYIEKGVSPSVINTITALKNSGQNYRWSLVVDAINKENKPLWRHLKATAAHAVLFDMKYRGVAFFDSHRIGQCYCL